MSEISNHQQVRADGLHELFMAVMHQQDAVYQIKKHEKLINQTLPEDIINLIDRLMQENHPLPKLKIATNKFLNVLGKTLQNIPDVAAATNSLIWVMQQNNHRLIEVMTQFKLIVKELNQQTTPSLIEKAAHSFETILEFESYYTIKENIVFPLLEKHWSNFRCLQMMWSFHDDIRMQMKEVKQLLNASNFELKSFNKHIGDLYFNIYAIRLREEKLLFHYIHSTIESNQLNSLLPECMAIGFPYFQPDSLIGFPEPKETNLMDGYIDMGTGLINIQQLILIFNHLPVDITFVDAQDKVRFFSQPPHRIFPRSKAIIGRDVHNCHPPESVHIVHQIIDSFRNGRKDQASFWINMKGQKILIQYFALRDSDKNYQGVIEVSQEISALQAISGEKRLLDDDFYQG